MRDDPGRVLDILEAIDRIDKGAVKGKDFFYHDEMTQVWVIHHLQIIGEAVKGISPEFRMAHPDIPWSEIIGMRNILVHHYFGIDRDAVWKVVEHDLPVLKKQFSRPV
ncbi:DUF86 domain-containing protein [Methanoregula sp.]|uniref:HepT-like ribonuclease domain-containing protein n=1 Tax=Methanoregula sp. TaxID=2052170 RepID=UPI002623BC37|nr:DUF86 domain-containing protein [Methanoregula sp.]MDD5144285.1 DUF86 domain-containing protein [Methanoregula sp.]